MSLSSIDDNKINENADMLLRGDPDDLFDKYIDADKIYDCITDNTVKYVSAQNGETSFGLFCLIWDVLYFVVKNEIEKRGIAQQVLKRFIPTALALYRIDDSDNKMREYIKLQHKAVMQELSDANISTDNSDGILRSQQLIYILAKELKIYDGPLLPSKHQETHFLLAATTVKRQVTEILSYRNYDITRKLIEESNRAAAERERKENSRSAYKMLVFCLLIIVGLFAWALSDAFSNDPQKNVPVPTETKRTLVEMKRPQNGEIIYKGTRKGLAPFEIFAPPGYDCYCVLKSITNSSDTIKFFVRAGEGCEILVPLGNYELYYAAGTTWYGRNNLFGEETSYQKCDDTFQFTEEANGYSGWTVSLTRVQNGNLDSEYISEDEFPN